MSSVILQIACAVMLKGLGPVLIKQSKNKKICSVFN